jgi:trans-2,3-dihydro-3-hydroxyanthranilate isomerase
MGVSNPIEVQHPNRLYRHGSLLAAGGTRVCWWQSRERNFEMQANTNKGHPFCVANAFSIRGVPFSGNPAGVVFRGDQLDDVTKQVVARQLNLVETTFICAATEADFRFRYFTPTKELPVTGHPTVAAIGAMLNSNLLQENAKVTIETAGGQIQAWVAEGLIWVNQLPASFRPIGCDLDRLSAAMGMAPDDIAMDLTPEVSDVGLGHIIAKLKDPDALRRAQINIESLAMVCAASGAREAQIFAQGGDGTVHTRNLCPRLGEEDPACGNGNAALGALLAKHGLLHVAQTLTVDQGSIVNRPSRIHVQRMPDHNSMISVSIGGECRVMVDGHIHLGRGEA